MYERRHRGTVPRRPGPRFGIISSLLIE
jgi:hypothetical protein